LLRLNAGASRQDYQGGSASERQQSENQLSILH
jgi:hypothetical protein